MKKKIGLSVFLGIVISIILGIQNFAQARVVSNDPTVSSGSTVSITLTTSNAVASFKSSLVDAGGLTFVSATKNGAFEMGATNGSTVNGITAGEPSRTLVTYTFKAPESAETKKYTVKFSVSGMDNEADTTNTSTVTVNGTGGSTGGNEGGSTGGTGNGGNNSSGGDTISSHSFKNVNETVYAKELVRVRKEPNGEKLGTLNKGEAVTRTGVGNQGWDRVSWEGRTAYVSSQYLTTTAPVEEKPDEEKPDEEKPDENQTEPTAEEQETPVASLADLATITIEEGNISPAFSKDVTEYTMNISDKIEELHIEAVPADENSKVSISGNTDLKLGSNLVTITVTASDGSTKVYKIHVTRRGKSDLALTTLKISALNMEIPLKEGVFEYAFKLESEKLLQEIEFTALANKEGARIEITGNKDLKEGENVIHITIISADGEEQVNYIVTVTNALKPGASTGIQMDVTLAIVIGTILLTAYIIALLFIWKYVSDKKKEDLEEDIPVEEMEAIGANAKEHSFEGINDMRHYEELQDVEQDMEKESAPKKKKGKHF